MKKGFTLIELMISIGIITLVTAIVVVNYRKFDSTIIITDLAYDIGISIRKAQSYGLGVRGFNDGGTIKFDFAYGIYFTLDPSDTDPDNGPDAYTVFVDANANGLYSNDTERVERFRLQNGYTVSDLCYEENAVEECDDINELDITFKRPNPDATIYADGVQTVRSAGIIYIRSQQGSQKKIIVRSTGQISISDAPDAP